MPSFFDPPPSPTPPEPPAITRPAWTSPPTGVLGELVVDRLVVYRSDSLVVSLEHVRAYPDGVELRACLRSRHSPVGSNLSPLAPGPVRPGRAPHPPLAPGDLGLRLGVALADGTRLTNLSPHLGIMAATAPRAPLLVQLTAGPVGQRWDQRFWFWGLPLEGPLAFVVESPAYGVPERRVELEGGDIRRAAGRAEVLWPDTVLPGTPYPVLPHAVFVPEPRLTEHGPDDEDGARAGIEAAFAAVQRVEGDELVHVEDGENLLPVLRELQQRFDVARSALHRVERVVFVSDTEAAVWLSVWLGPSPYLVGHRGDAVFVDGRWKVSRDTFCGLLARVGVPCPPRS